MTDSLGEISIFPIGQGHGFQSLVRGLLPLREHLVLLASPAAEVPKRLSLRTSNKTLRQSLGEQSLFISSGFKQKIPQSFLDQSTFINIHYALFPKFRGMHSIVWAILNGEKQIGITVHKMDETLDSGPIVAQYPIDISDKTSWELMLECNTWVESHIADIVVDFLNGTLPATPQNHRLATFVTKRTIDDCRVIWSSWNAEFFSRALRALVHPYPLPFFSFDGINWEVTSAEVWANDYLETAGKVVYRDKYAVYVKLNGGLLKLKSVKEQGGDGTNVSALKILTKIGLRLS